MILMLKSFIEIGTIIFHKKLLTRHVAVTVLNVTRKLLFYPTLEVQHAKILSGESILLANTKEYTL